MHIVHIIETVLGKASREEVGMVGEDQPPAPQAYTLKPTCFIPLTGFLAGPGRNVINCNF